LRFADIVKFKGVLARKLEHTHSRSTDPSYTTFLKHFGQFKVASIPTKEVSEQKFIIEELAAIRKEIHSLQQRTTSIDVKEDIADLYSSILKRPNLARRQRKNTVAIDVSRWNTDSIAEIIKRLSHSTEVAQVTKDRVKDGSEFIVVEFMHDADANDVEIVENLAREVADNPQVALFPMSLPIRSAFSEARDSAFRTVNNR
jgi:hypothetical protein